MPTFLLIQLLHTVKTILFEMSVIVSVMRLCGNDRSHKFETGNKP